MKDTRRARRFSLVGVVLLTATMGIASRQLLAKRAAAVVPSASAPDEDFRDSVASLPALARVSGKPVPASWFKSPGQHRADVETALLSSRRRRSVRGLQAR